MYNCSLYFPRIDLFIQPPSLFLKSENVDEEHLIAEAEAVLDRNEALVKSSVRYTLFIAVVYALECFRLLSNSSLLIFLPGNRSAD